MANSYVEYSAAGTGTNGLGQTTFSYSSVDVISADHIYCKNYFYNGSSFEWAVASIASRNASAKTITLNSVPVGTTQKIRIYRDTVSTPLIDFVDGARLTESDLDTAYKQGLLATQEVKEDAAANGNTGVANLSLTGTTTVANLTSTGTVVIPSGNAATHFYREGTWTPGSVVGNITATLAHFTKIGRLVNFTCKATFSDTTTASTLQVNGLPYTPSIGMAVGSAMWRNTDAVSRYGTVHVTTGGNIEFYDASQTGGFLELKHSYLDGSSSEVFFSGTYHTA